jgi:sulfate transport system ATP-binding protein
LRRLHDELHITSVFVTHDQEEALEVADRIVVLNHGVVEQVGAPSEVSDQPATPFVYQFLGNVNLFHGRVHAGFAHVGEVAVAAPEYADAQRCEALAYVRPHDIEIARENPDRNALPATIERIQLVGPVARLTLRRQDADEPVEAEIPRERYAALALTQGERVFIKPRRPRIFLR